MIEKSPSAATDDALAPRLAAYNVVQAVLQRRRALEDAMAGEPTFTQLSGAARGFAGFLIRTTLRRLRQIDMLIDHCLNEPLPPNGRAVRDVLRVGIAQLLFSQTADHASVDTSVEMCRVIGFKHQAKMVNAVLRRLQREGAGLIDAQDVARLNTPAWLWESWCTAYGEATTRAIASQHLDVPPVDLSPKADDADTWATKLDGQTILAGSIRLAGLSDVTALDGFEAGAWWVQDAAARLPAKLLGDVKGQTVLDLCAAPGGKTLELAAAGGIVTALDISAKRLNRVRDNLTRTGLSAALVASDARKWRPEALADAVLLDAPCSSTGTLRRHPDIQHLKSAADITKLAQVQDDLLDAAVEMLRPGGLLVFATCSLQPEEGPERIDAFLRRYPDFARVPIQPAEIGGLQEAATPAGDLRTLPSQLADHGGLDGFFAARLIKNAA